VLLVAYVIPRFKKSLVLWYIWTACNAALTAALAVLQTQHFEVAILFCPICGCQRTLRSCCLRTGVWTGFSKSNNRENSKRDLG